MKHRIAPEIDRLMWLVAEQRDPKAISEFEERFPELRLELSKRIAMLSGLMVAGKTVIRKDIPRFSPRVERSRPPVNRFWYVAAAAALGAVAFASYSFTVMSSRPQTHIPTVNPVHVEPLKGPDVVYKQPEIQPFKTPQQNPTPTPKELPVVKVDPMDKLITVKADEIPLSDALSLIGQSAGIQIELAPGVENDNIVLDYANVSTVQILDDLGQRYGFTAFPQEKGRLLIIPARAKDGSHPPVNGIDPNSDGTGDRPVNPQISR